MIIGYTGISGSGKTYSMTSLGLSLIARGKIVFSRHELEGAYPILDERELLRMHDCHVFFDEWHQDHSAKEWWDLDEVVKHIVTQARKYSITIHWSAQHWSYMDSFIRKNTDICWRHEALFPDPETGESRIGLHRREKVAGLSEELKHRRPKILSKKYFFIKKNVYESYDSYKPIMISKAKLSDAEIEAIRDPYLRPRTHITRAIKRNRAAAALMATPDPAKDGETDFVPEKGRLDHNEQPEDGIELREGQEYADDRSPSMEVLYPVKDLAGQRARRRQYQEQQSDQSRDDGNEESGDHISPSSAV